MEEIRVENCNGCVTTPICTFNTGDSLLDKELKKVIPTEMLARGSVTNTTDLNSFFNSINTI